MQRASRAVAAIAVLAVTLSGAPSQAALPSGIATPSGAVLGFDMPESAVWDARTGAWYISNFGGNSGGGFIAKLLPGAMEPEVFATGLSSPQGIVIEGSTLYAADGNTVRIIDMDDPSERQAIEVPGASFGDLDVDPVTGDIYAGELMANRIWRIRGGTPEVWATINSPDGLYLFDGGLYISNFAIGGDGGIFRIDLATASVTPVSVIPGAFLDGLERDGDGWLTTDFVKGQLIRVAADGTFSILAQLAPSAADIGWNAATRTVAVPELLLSVVVFLQL